MTTTTTAVALVCLFVNHVGVVRNVKPEDMHLYWLHGNPSYMNRIEFPCNKTDNEALILWNTHIHQGQNEACPHCYPNDAPWRNGNEH